ncbi:flagellar motor switch protein FliM [Paramesorhizobium deserti]|uniref:Flagellar motor switch protein FliM n=1 Tax=Paramesorhizobium deserti TaxID=1494590 RepID=A0A135HS95_9HYPH|nr:FliM/FliN family flagellar motor switch protein [Paramesorhizobium deserti]KXF76033.1 flagellar motor switch protein FliM [Paramesorhizobium deserti]
MTAFASDRKPDVLADSILRAAGISVDDLKSLGHVFKDAATTFSARFKELTPVSVETDVSGMETVEKAQVGTLLPAGGMIVPVEVDRWGSTIHMVADRAFIFSGLEALFGAGANFGAHETIRGFTSVERRIAGELFAHMAAALDHVFASGDERIFNVGKPLETGEFDPEKLDQSRLFACGLTIRAAGKTGKIRLLMPRTCHRPMQEAIARLLRQPSAHSDPAWAKKIRLEVSRARVSIEAFIHQGTMTLGEIAQLQPGHVLKLPADAIEQVRLRSGNQALFKCTLGKAGINFTVRISDPVSEEEDLIDELAAG